MDMSPEQEKLIRKWRARSKRSQIAHHDSAIWAQRFHFCLGIPLVIASTVSAALIYATLSVEYKWVTSVVSLCAVILASLQTFLSFSEKSSSHRNAACRYRDLKEDLELVLLQPLEDNDLDKWLKDMKEKRSNVSAISPSVYGWSWRSAKKETQEENDNNSVRN